MVAATFVFLYLLWIFITFCFPFNLKGFGCIDKEPDIDTTIIQSQTEKQFDATVSHS